jgi:squalene-hopene/tetraprenyl-beta-curcumene cyclase
VKGKLSAVIFVFAFLASFGPLNILAAGGAGNSEESVLKNTLGKNSENFDEARKTGTQKAITYLESIQKEDGSFPSFFGLGTTELAMMCFQKQGMSPEDAVLKKGIGYILSLRKPDGSFYSDTEPQGKEKTSFTTALAIRLFSALKDGKNKKMIEDALAWIKDIQNVDGGFGYYKGSRSDITATTFCIRALNDGYMFLGLPKNDETWIKAFTYVKNLQNKNGGFGYLAGKMEKEEGEEDEELPTAPYGSATASGLISLFYVEAEKTDMDKALDWVSQHYTWDENPLDPDPKHYQYYVQELATALTLAGKETIKDKKGQKHFWYKEVVRKLEKEQAPAGFWVTDKEPLFTTYFISVMQLENAKKNNGPM